MKVIMKAAFACTALGILGSFATAQESLRTKNNSQLDIHCYSSVKNGQTQQLIKKCSKSSAATSYSQITVNGEKSIIVEGSQGQKCVITETLAKKSRVPFSLVADLIANKRFHLQCSYKVEGDQNAAAENFSIRGYLE